MMSLVQRVVAGRRVATQSVAALRRRGLSTGGGILNEEERAAENIFIKKQEAERMEFLKKLKEGKTAEDAEAAARAAGHAAHSTSQATAGPTAAEGGSSMYALGGAALAGLGLGWFLFGGK